MSANERAGGDTIASVHVAMGHEMKSKTEIRPFEAHNVLNTGFFRLTMVSFVREMNPGSKLSASQF